MEDQETQRTGRRPARNGDSQKRETKITVSRLRGRRQENAGIKMPLKPEKPCTSNHSAAPTQEGRALRRSPVQAPALSRGRPGCSGISPGRFWNLQRRSPHSLAGQWLQCLSVLRGRKVFPLPLTCVYPCSDPPTPLTILRRQVLSSETTMTRHDIPHDSISIFLFLRQ